MATKLDKDLIRETTVVMDGREVILTLSDKQQIKMKLKGMKTGEVTIDIEKLYKQLTGKENDSEDDEDDEDGTPSTHSMKVITRDEDTTPKGKILIDLEELRSMNAITGFDVPTMAKFDGVISDLIKHQKEIKEAQKVAGPSTNKKKKK